MNAHQRAASGFLAFCIAIGAVSGPINGETVAIGIGIGFACYLTVLTIIAFAIWVEGGTEELKREASKLRE